MREVCKSGAVVAAVVAVLEKQNLASSKNSKNSISVTQKNENLSSPGYDRNNARSRSTSDSKNITCLDDGFGFESAVKDFNSVAEDVQKFCSTDSLKRTAKFITKTDSPSESDSLEEELNGNHVMGGGSSDSESDNTTDSEDEKEHLISEGLATITEELSVHSSQEVNLLEPEDDSSLEDDSTLKGQQTQAWSETYSNPGSTSDLSSTSSETASNLRDSSTRCNSDFQWIRKEPPSTPPPPPPQKMEDVEQITISKPPLNRSVREKTPRKDKIATESLDRRKRQQNRIERDQKSRSSHILKSPPRLDDYTGGVGGGVAGCQNWCCNPHEFCYDGFQRRHERLDPLRYGSNPMLEREQHHRFMERGSHPDIYGDFGRYRHEMQCCSYHMTPLVPPCCYYGDRNYHWPASATYPKVFAVWRSRREVQKNPI